MLSLPEQKFLSFSELAKRWKCEESVINYLVETNQLPTGDKFAALRGKRNTLFKPIDPNDNSEELDNSLQNEDDQIVTVKITDHNVPFWDEIIQSAKESRPESSIPVIFIADIHKFESTHTNLNALNEKLGVGKRQQQFAIIQDVIKKLGLEAMNIPVNGKAEIKALCLSNHPEFFTDAGFDHTWKEGRKDDLFKMANHDSFVSK